MREGDRVLTPVGPATVVAFVSYHGTGWPRRRYGSVVVELDAGGGRRSFSAGACRPLTDDDEGGHEDE